jgi:hypothetical protein
MKAGEAGAPGLSCEIRLERIQRLGDLRLDHLKRFYNWQSIAEGYDQGWVEFHIHGSFSGLPFRGRYRSANQSVMPHDHEIIVSMHITHFLKVNKPSIPSIVRLQLLDFCDMSVIDPLKKPGSLPLELIWRFFDRKLCVASLSRCVEHGQSDGQVVKGRPKAPASFTDQDSEFIRDRDAPPCNGEKMCELTRAYGTIGASLDDRRFSLSGDNLVMQSFKFLQMFPCPVNK